MHPAQSCGLNNRTRQWGGLATALAAKLLTLSKLTTRSFTYITRANVRVQVEAERIYVS